MLQILNYSFKNKKISELCSHICNLLQVKNNVDYRLVYNADIISDYITNNIDTDDIGDVNYFQGLLNLMGSAVEIRKILYDSCTEENIDFEFYREIALEKTVLIDLDQLKTIDGIVLTLFDILEESDDILIRNADRISLRYAYLIYLWTIRETYTGNDNSVYVNNFVLERIEYLTISNHFDNYESAKIKKLVAKIIAVHSNRIDINREIESFNGRLYDVFKNSHITTLISNFNHKQKKDSNSDGEIVSMEYNKKDIRFTFEYTNDKTTFGNTIRFGQEPVFASFKLDILGDYYTVFESRYVPFYGLKFTTTDSIKGHEYTELANTCVEYMNTFNHNCEVCDTILLDEPSSVLTQKYHFNLFEFRGKLEKHIQVTKMFKEQYQHMLEHLYYMYMIIQYNDSKNHSKIKKL